MQDVAFALTETGVASREHTPEMGSVIPIKRQGKPENFTPDEARVLREGLQRWVKNENEVRSKSGKKRLTQTEIGRLLGIAQQSAQKIMARGDAGMSYQTAKRIAELQGFASPDEMFRNFLPIEEGTTDDVVQRSAMIAARRAGVTQKAIDVTNERLKGVRFRKEMSWIAKYTAQQEELNMLASEDEAEQQPVRRKRPPKTVR